MNERLMIALGLGVIAGAAGLTFWLTMRAWVLRTVVQYGDVSLVLAGLALLVFPAASWRP